MTSSNAHPTIFVQIASYRDTECQWTVKDLFEKAQHPERVFVGICQQNDPELDKDCFLEPYPFPEQVRESHFLAEKSEGVCWARYEAQQLYEGEDYVLMIDSHMRFVQDWDSKIIEELKRCDSKKPILSGYPPGYTPPNNLVQNAMPSVMRVKQGKPGEDIRGDGIALPNPPDHPLPGVFLAAGFLFAPGKLVTEVPYDPYMYFNQEELSLAIRMYTHGWDMFHPMAVFVYHMYIRLESKQRPLHWEDNKDWIHMQNRSLKRLYHLAGHKHSAEPDVLKELDKFGLGFQRTLQEFIDFSGVDLKNWKLTPKAEHAEFIPGLENYKYAPLPSGETKQASGNAQQTSLEKMPEPLPDIDESTSTLLSPLGAGQYLPAFILPDQNNKPCKIENFSGFHLALIFLPTPAEGYIEAFKKAYGENLSQWQSPAVQALFILRGTPSQAANAMVQLEHGRPVLADENGALFAAFGYERSHAARPFTVIADRNLKISHIVSDSDATKHHDTVIEALNFNQQAGISTPPLHAPALFVPQAINQVMADKLRGYFDSLVKDGAGCQIKDPMLTMELDDYLNRSLFPEIQKSLHFNISHREPYRLARTAADVNYNSGRYRDTASPEAKHRRFTLRIPFSTGFTGGEISFPEYGEEIYAIPPMSALVYSTEILFMNKPVTAGNQYTLSCFLFDNAAEEIRKQHIESQGTAYNPEEARCFTGRLFPGLELSK